MHRFNKQLREGTKCKCANCNGCLVFATKGPNAETETFELEVPDFEILASDLDKPKSIGSKELPTPKVTETGGPFLSSARRLFPFVLVGFSALALEMLLPTLTFSKTDSLVKDQPAKIKAQAEVFLVSEEDKWIAHQPTPQMRGIPKAGETVIRGLSCRAEMPLIVARVTGGCHGWHSLR
jgi:hypothetical protein